MQQFGLFAGSGASPAPQALLQPTAAPVESNGPSKGAGPSRRSSLSFKPVFPVCIVLTVGNQVDGAAGDAAASGVVDADGKVESIDDRDCKIVCQYRSGSRYMFAATDRRTSLCRRHHRQG